MKFSILTVYCKSVSMQFVFDIALTTGYFLNNPVIRPMLEISYISLDIRTICICLCFFFVVCFGEKNK